MVNHEKFYQMSDVVKKLDVTHAGLIKLIDEGHLKPLFYVPLAKFVIGGVDHLKGFVAFGTASYGGYVSIQKKDFERLWSNSTVEAKVLLIPKKSEIQDYSPINPFEHCFPRYFGTWQSTQFADITRSKVLAVPYPLANYCEVFGDSLDEQAIIFSIHDIYFSGDELNASFAQKLNSNNNQISNSELISVTNKSNGNFSVESVIAIPTDNTEFLFHDKLCKSVVAVHADLFKNEFEELIARILAHKPLLKAKEIHRILCREALLEEGSRFYDKSDILLGETEGVISWRDKYCGNNERSYKLDSLRNVISRARKICRQISVCVPRV